jgi:hypothetical protein
MPHEANNNFLVFLYHFKPDHSPARYKERFPSFWIANNPGAPGFEQKVAGAPLAMREGGA